MVKGGDQYPESRADFAGRSGYLLARYMVARWSAHYVAWILPGDGDYGGSKAERWQRIGRAVFGEGPHAPVLLHPKGMHLPLAEFREETWLDINAYQSGHGDDESTLAWIVAGPPAKAWSEEPIRPSEKRGGWRRSRKC